MIIEAKRELFVVDPKTVKKEYGSYIVATGKDGVSQFSFMCTISNLIYALKPMLSDSEDEVRVRTFRQAAQGDMGALSELKSLGEELVREYSSVYSVDDLVLGVAVRNSIRGRGIEFLHREIGVWRKVN